jgi:hypothetical protein
MPIATDKNLAHLADDTHDFHREGSRLYLSAREVLRVFPFIGRFV